MAADAPRLALPLACTPGQSCWIVNHVDRDPGPGVQDYACGRMSYDGHDGTDIAVRDVAAMQAGMPVLAAAAGRVRGVRDGMQDISRDTSGAPSIEGVECGNGVVIEHGAGWESQYCHMRRGSVAVRTGQEVAAGERLGFVGLSGETVFPHLHFEIRRDKRSVDPFAPSALVGCDLSEEGLWDAAAAPALAYRGGEVYIAGVAPRPVTAEAMHAGVTSAALIDPATSELTIYADLLGVVIGDRLTIRMKAPTGALLFDSTATIERTQIRKAFFGREPRPAGGWPVGAYAVTFAFEQARTGLTRTTEIIFEVR